jgi:VanZ family protein
LTSVGAGSSIIAVRINCLPEITLHHLQGGLRDGGAHASLLSASTIRSRCEKVAVGAEMKFHFRAGAKVCSIAIMVLLLIGALGPANWTPRTAFGWQIDHFLGYFAITLLVCFAWMRPVLVGAILTAAAFLLEGLQALTPDRSANLEAALCSAGGVLAGALVAELFIRAWRRHPQSDRSAKSNV